MRLPPVLVASLACVVAAAAAPPARAVLFASTGDPAFNTTPPGGALAGSGWDLQGEWNGLSGTPIGPEHFVTAEHGGGAVGDVFVFRGESYVTDAVARLRPQSDADLAIWHVTRPFPEWAELYRGDDEVGREIVVFGRGWQRGAEIVVDGTPRGWGWGVADGLRRWGTNTVSAIATDIPDEGELLAATFDPGASATEAHLASGDSGGGVFLQDDDGRWKLAGIANGVDAFYVTDLAGTLLDTSFPGLAALYDSDGLFLDRSPGARPIVPAGGPGRLYAVRLSAYQDWIDAVVPAPEPGAAAAGAVAALAALARRRRS